MTVEPMDEQEAFVRKAAEIANARSESGHPANTDELRQVIEEHDVVVGVWQDTEQPYGVGVLVIKGEQIVHASADTGEDSKATLTAIPCREAEEALAMRDVFGDPTRHH